MKDRKCGSGLCSVAVKHQRLNDDYADYTDYTDHSASRRAHSQRFIRSDVRVITHHPTAVEPQSTAVGDRPGMPGRKGRGARWAG